MSKRQLTERQKLRRDLEELIALRALPCGSKEYDAAIKRLVMRKRELSPFDLKRREARWVAMGKPDYTSPEWLAELERLRKVEQRKGKQPVPPPNTDAADFRSLYWQYQIRAALQAAGRTVELVEVPGQRREGHTKEQQAKARRMYRWLWRTFPGLLKACDDELRGLIRRAAGIA